MSDANNATQTGFKKVEYTDSDGCKYTMSGGTLTWRNNNPGALRYGSDAAARAAGAIGRDAQGYGIFPTYDEGEIAMRDKIAGEWGYHDVNSLIPIYAPYSDGNNEAEYIAWIVSKGVDPDQTISSMTVEQFNALIYAIISKEVFGLGTYSSYKCPNGSYKTMTAPGSPTTTHANQNPPQRPDNTPTYLRI